MRPDDYAHWTAAQPQGDDLAQEGAALFGSLGCSGCHAAALRRCTRPTWPASTAAPSSSPTAGTVNADEAYIRDSILHAANATSPPAIEPIMPSFTGRARRRRADPA